MSDIRGLEEIQACLSEVNDRTSKEGLHDAIEDARYLVDEMLDEALRAERLVLLAGARTAMRETACN